MPTLNKGENPPGITVSSKPLIIALSAWLTAFARSQTSDKGHFPFQPLNLKSDVNSGKQTAFPGPERQHSTGLKETISEIKCGEAQEQRENQVT